MNEVLISSAESTSLYDLQNGSAIASFNLPPAAHNATALVPSKNGQGGLILSMAATKPLLHVYSFQKNQPLHNMVLPEKISCLDVDHNATWCAAGTPSGRVYLWELASGSLFKSFAAHYRGITVLRFHSDAQTFVTGSEDSVISVWSIPRRVLLSQGSPVILSVVRIVDYELETQIPTPMHNLTDHTLPITSLQLGFGPLTSARIFSASLDGTVKVWCVDAHTSSEASGSSCTLMTTFTFPIPVVEIVVDPLERFFFAAMSGEKGEVRVVNMYTEKEERTVTKSLANGILGGVHSVIDIPNKAITVGAKVTALTLTATSRLLIGTNQGQINIYDAASLQLIKTIQTSQSTAPIAVTFLSTVSKPVDLVGHVQLNGRSHEESIPVRQVLPFARARDTKGKGREILMVLPNRPHVSQMKYNPLNDHSVFSPPSTHLIFAAKMHSEDPEARADRLEAEVAKLKDMLDKAKSINDAMWENLVQQAAAQARSQ